MDRGNKHKAVSKSIPCAVHNTNVKVYDTNPYSAGSSNPFENVLKITVKGVSLSVDDNEVMKMLKTSTFPSQVISNMSKFVNQLQKNDRFSKAIVSFTFSN